MLDVGIKVCYHLIDSFEITVRGLKIFDPSHRGSHVSDPFIIFSFNTTSSELRNCVRKSNFGDRNIRELQHLLQMFEQLEVKFQIPYRRFMLCNETPNMTSMQQTIPEIMEVRAFVLTVNSSKMVRDTTPGP
jgi:hypothetical protein